MRRLAFSLAVVPLLLVVLTGGFVSGANHASQAPAPSADPMAKTVSRDALAVATVDALRAAAGGEVEATWSATGFAQALYGKLGTYGEASEQAARLFLSQNGAAFGIDRADAELRLCDTRVSPIGTHLTFSQDYLGLPVFGAQVSVNFNQSGEVIVAGGDYASNARVASTTPSIAPAAALAAVVATIDGATARRSDAPELGIFIDAAGEPHLAYHVVVPVRRSTGVAETYESYVDAASAALLSPVRDINLYATGKVYQKGNAMAALNNSLLEDTSSIGSGAYTTVTLANLQSTSGLVGAWVDTYTNTKSRNRATPDASGNYTYTRSTNASTGAKFDAVNVYYYIDFAQTYIQSLGFSNVNHRRVLFNINGTTQDNSWYSPNSSGTGSLTIGSGGVDDGEDAEVVLHEYGHSIQDNQKPGVWGGSVTGAMGEGWGDYWGCSITTQHFGQAGTAYENTVMEWDASSYSSAIPPTIRSITSTKHYPQNWVGEVHADGEMWSSTLWQIRNDFIGLNGTYAAGAQRADKVFLQAHFLMTSSSNTFRDGANAIITAATNLGYSQAEIDAIRNRFTQRGMLP